MQIVVTTAPTVEPVDLAEAKDQLRVRHAAEDTLIGLLVRAARSYVETALSRALITQTIRLELPAFPRDHVISLPRPPLLSLTDIKYRDAGNTLLTLDPATYVVAPDTVWPKLALAPGTSAWPVTCRHPAAVQINYQAGYGPAATDVPDPIRHAIRLLIEHYYANRGATSEGSRAVVPMAVDMLLSPYRVSGWI